ncbi:Eukaryotic/viral aspartic protease, active site [Phytophthora sojae]|uniref:Eukaryotic/viral aspartic protease, active site n=1 Tax=Phytophthora sojae (strain P6497) TaxID=1094619 RepID=G4YWN5_PHYSP|nr:Eukaryotic/viral aspartic protease, active site [Phytophthora sojae]EGZ23216.1 Eukaryotic/viral aspartic protease, active site [Phytophthora sojae]|eukprot:XP_009518504.1 Eukaryotic/viral aspartic protease, active site [Phytophthora sojae]
MVPRPGLLLRMTGQRSKRHRRQVRSRLEGHGASDDLEGYEEPFAVPDVAPDEGAAKGRDASRGPTGRKPAKAGDQQQPTAKAATKRKSPKRKKKSCTRRTRRRSRYPSRKARTRDVSTPSRRYGPFVAPDFDSLTSVVHAALTLFQMLRDSGFVLGAFEMERLCDWDLKSWLRAISVVQEPLTILAGSVKQGAASSATGQGAPSPSAGAARTSTTTPSPPPRYQSSVDSDSSFESPKRMPMNRPPRVMQLSAAPARAEVAKPAEGAIPKALEESIIKLMQATMMRTPRAETPAVPVESKQPTHPAAATIRPQETADVAMESDPHDRFDVDVGTPRAAAAVSTATAGVGLTRVRLSASSELKEFSGRDAGEEKARLWLNRLKSAARRDGMTGEEVCGLFSDLMSRPARQWYLQLPKKVKKSWTELMEQFRVQYCGKGVSMASRYYHAAQRPDETPLDYLYRLNVAGLRHFIRTLNTQEAELASRLTLMEVADSEALEKKLRARQRGLAHQKKTLFGSNKFRQKAPTPPTQPARTVHAIPVASDEYDSERESRDTIAKRAPRISAVRRTTDDEFAREPPLDEIDLQPGERRGYWKHYAPHKWYKQAKIHGKLNNRRAVLLLDTGAEVSILDTMRVKITLAGNLVYYMHLWVGDLVGQHAILGMNFMVPAGVRIDTADGTACLPDEVHIQMIGRRPLYGARTHPVNVKTPTANLGTVDSSDWAPPGTSSGRIWQVPPDDHKQKTGEEAVEVEPDGPPTVAGSAAMKESPESKLAEPKLAGPEPAEPERDEAKPDEQEEDDAVLIHEGSDLFAEELESEMAVLPDLSLTAEVKIEDLKVGVPTGLPPEEAARQETRLRQIIWKRRKWLIGKGNALPPAALGVVCDIDVGDAKPVAQRVRKIPPEFREKVADLIKGLLSARMI